MKVLIIDDSPMTVRLVQASLSRDSLDVISADNGACGAEAVKNEKPDLIILDVKLPDMSGFDLCGDLKSEAELCDIPIIFLSASDNPEDTVRGLNLGAVDYITKPFNELELEARVNAALRTKYMQDLLNQRANIDQLTGLANRQAMAIRLKEEWARVERHKRPLSLIMIEIDRFNRISETHGHSAVDRALQVTAETIASQCRQIDLPASCGGAEFAIIAPDASAENACILARRCQNLISKMELKVNGEEIWVTASFGIADVTGKAGIKDLTREASKALRQAKADGGNRVVVEQSAGSPV